MNDPNVPVHTLLYQTHEYYQTKTHCDRQRQLFEDTYFPTSHPTHYRLPPSCPPNGALSHLRWIRATEIWPHARFVPPSGPVASDVVQGLLGNCWFLGACATLTTAPQLLEQVMPQPWAGALCTPTSRESVFRFRFWKWGRWIEVLVDDRLAFLCTPQGVLADPPRLAFSHGRDPSVIWSALLEKAYAKLHGSYAALDAGTSADAFIDMTGGFVDVVDMRHMNTVAGAKLNPTQQICSGGIVHTIDELWRVLKEAEMEGHLINCTNKSSDNSVSQHEPQLTPAGLMKTHVYSVVGIESFAKKLSFHSLSQLTKFFSDRKHHLLVLRNPWAIQKWGGKWSRSSPEWNELNGEQQAKLQSLLRDEGYFLLSIEDFIANFTHASICKKLPPSALEFSFFGGWYGPTAGGCVDNASWHQNPQYHLTLHEEGRVIISLQQREFRFFGFTHQTDLNSELSIGVHLFRVEANRTSRIHHPLRELPGTKKFSNTRQVTHTLHLKQGHYVIVPATFHPGVQGDYLLRVGSFARAQCQPLTEDRPRDALTPDFGSAISFWIAECRGVSKEFFIRYGIGSKQYQTRLVRGEQVALVEEGALFYVKRGEQGRGVFFHLDIFHPRTLQGDKQIGQAQVELSRILSKPPGSHIRITCPISGMEVDLLLSHQVQAHWI